MIRVNLVQAKRSRRADAGQRQLLYMGASLVGVVAILVVVQIHLSGKLDALSADNQKVQAEIDHLKAELGDYEKVKAQREELLKQRKSIEALEAGRTGPVFLLRELSEILTPGKGPTFDRVIYEEALRRDPNVGFNASWDTRRVWLESYDEQQKKVKIKGAAKSNDDVAEFMKRLNSSVFFNGVRLESSNQTGNTGTSFRYITFNLTTEVVY